MIQKRALNNKRKPLVTPIELALYRSLFYCTSSLSWTQMMQFAQAFCRKVGGIFGLPFQISTLYKVIVEIRIDVLMKLISTLWNHMSTLWMRHYLVMLLQISTSSASPSHTLKKYESHVNGWILFAASRGVQEIDLEFYGKEPLPLALLAIYNTTSWFH